MQLQKADTEADGHERSGLQLRGQGAVGRRNCDIAGVGTISGN